MLWWGHLSWLLCLPLGSPPPPPRVWLSQTALLLIPARVPVLVALDHLHQRPFVGAKFLLQLSIGDDVFVLPLSFQGLVLLILAYPTCQDQCHFTFVEDSGDFFQALYMACL